MDNVLLQKIRDEILSVSNTQYGVMDSKVYLQQIRDAINRVTDDHRGDMAEHVYLQQIRDAFLGVTGTKFGNLSEAVYLQQIIDAAMGYGISTTKPGNLDEETYLKKILANGYKWWLAGGIDASYCVAAYQAKGADSLAASYINLAGLAQYNAAPGVAPTWDVTNGWIFDGLAQYLTTKIIPVNQSSTLILSLGYVVPGASKYPCAVLDTSIFPSPYYGLRTESATRILYLSGGQLNITGIPSYSKGILAVSGNLGYRNGIVESGTITNVANTPTKPMYIGCRNNNGVAGNFTNCKINAFAYYNTILTAQHILALTNAMNAL